MRREKKLIGFAGRAGAGKSTAAKMLWDQGYAKMSFAAPIKEMVWMFLVELGIGTDEVEFYMSEKEEIIERLGCSARHLMQTLGTEWGRNCVDRDVWVEARRGHVDAVFARGLGVIIDDVRFENEADYIRQHGGLIIHIFSDKHRWPRRTEGDCHVSEDGICIMSDDVIVINDGSPYDLWRKVQKAVDKHIDPYGELIRLCNTPSWRYRIDDAA